MFKLEKFGHTICEVIKVNFIDNEHQEFFENNLKELSGYGKTDVYYKSLIYILGISESTRDHFKEIFDIKKRRNKYRFNQCSMANRNIC